MRYCLNYSIGKLKKEYEISELQVEFDRTDDSLPTFIKNHQNQIIVISLITNAAPTDIPVFVELYELYGNIKLKCNYDDVAIRKAVCESGVPYFFNDHVNSWDMLWGIMEEDPTDMYITDELGFELKEVARILHNNGINVRVFPNVAQSRWKYTPDIMKFFIRPEDVERYEPYVDVMEFYNMEKSVNTLYTIYNDKKEWFGNLNELITGFRTSVDNRNLFPSFGESRIGCEKKCNKGRCNLCQSTADIANLMIEKDMIMTVKSN